MDNLVWLIVDNETKDAAAVDGPEAGPVLEYCEAHGLKLTTVFNTHTHFDHIGINTDLEKRGLLASIHVVGPQRVRDQVPGLKVGVDEGDTVTFGGVEGRVMLTERSHRRPRFIRIRGRSVLRGIRCLPPAVVTCSTGHQQRCTTA